MKTAIWNPGRKPIIVGVSLDKNDELLIQSAAALARRLESPLELVHATQPIFNYMGAGDVVVNPYYGYDRVINDMEDEEARKGLQRVRQTLPADLAVGIHVLRDYTSEALTTMATELKAGMIVTGLGKRAGSNLLEGMSTAFSLAAHAEVPVLILPLGQRLAFEEAPRLLVADNMENEGQLALEAAVQMALALNAAAVCHLHVHTLSKKDAEHMVEKVREAMALGRIPVNPEFSTSTYMEQVRETYSDQLRARFRAVPGAAALTPRYQSLVSFGKPVEELHKTTQLHKPQLLVFGRHHLFHRQRFSLGKIPYDAMMEEGVATMIVPDTAAHLKSS
jgi:nucleotide-binding universal stress UspA family protein